MTKYFLTVCSIYTYICIFAFFACKIVCYQLIAVLVVGYSEALKCYVCQNCADNPTSNPTDCSDIALPDAAFCAKVTSTEGATKGQGS